MVSIHRPLGYEPSALPLRQQAFSTDAFCFDITYKPNPLMISMKKILGGT